MLTPSALHMFPNLASYNLQFSRNFHGKVMLYDYTGKAISKAKLQGRSLPVGHLSAGLYIIYIEEDGQRFTGKFQKPP